MQIDAVTKPLGVLAELRVGYPFRGAIEPVARGAVAVVQMKDVAPSGVLDWSRVVRTELTGRKAPDWLQAGDVLLVARGSRFYAVVLDEIVKDAVCGPHLCHVRLKRNSTVLPRFLAWQINQPPIQRLLRQAAEGSSQLSIRRAELEALPICVPPKAAQERIVRLADAARQERMLLEKLIENRERMLGSLAIALAAPSQK